MPAHYTGKHYWEDSMVISFGMLGRAEPAFWLNLAVPLTIRWWKPYPAGEKPLPFSLSVQAIPRVPES